MINNKKICGMIGLATKAGKIVAGTEACLQEIEKHNIKLLILATNTSERTKNIFKQQCKQYKVQMCEILTIDEISNSIGRANKAVIGIKDKGFAQAINKIINGGENIG